MSVKYHVVEMSMPVKCDGDKMAISIKCDAGIMSISVKGSRCLSAGINDAGELSQTRYQ